MSNLEVLGILDIDASELDGNFPGDARTEDDKGHIVIEELIHMTRHPGITVCSAAETRVAFLQKYYCNTGYGYLFPSRLK